MKGVGTLPREMVKGVVIPPREVVIPPREVVEKVVCYR
jgi:hypothetical protein